MIFSLNFGKQFYITIPTYLLEGSSQRLKASSLSSLHSCYKQTKVQLVHTIRSPSQILIRVAFTSYYFATNINFSFLKSVKSSIWIFNSTMGHHKMNTLQVKRPRNKRSIGHLPSLQWIYNENINEMVISVPEVPMEPVRLSLTSHSAWGHIIPATPPHTHVLIGFLFIYVSLAPTTVSLWMWLVCGSELHHNGCILDDNGPLSPTSFKNLSCLHTGHIVLPLWTCVPSRRNTVTEDTRCLYVNTWSYISYCRDRCKLSYWFSSVNKLGWLLPQPDPIFFLSCLEEDQPPFPKGLFIHTLAIEL